MTANNFDALEEAAVDAQLEAQAAAEKEALSSEKARAIELLERLDRLMRNEDFNFFVHEYLKPMLIEYHDGALNVTNKPEDRDRNAQRHYALDTALMKLQEECQRLRSEISQ